MGKSIKGYMNWYNIQQIEHIPGNFREQQSTYMYYSLMAYSFKKC